MRCMIAVLGGLVSGVGVGLTLSHGGKLGTSFSAAITWPAVIGVVLAVAAVFVQIRPAVRWLVLGIALVVFAFMGMDVGWTWRVALPLVGLPLSWLLARAIRALLATVRVPWTRLAPPLLGVLALGVVIGADVPLAAAQTSELCESGEIVVRLDDQRAVFRAGSNTVETLELPTDTTTLIVTANAAVDRGHVIIELIEASPFPELLNERPIVWSGELEPTGVGGGSTGPTLIRLERDGLLGTFVLRAEAHEEAIPLVAGEGLYRATFTSASGGDECFMTARLRVTASPLSTIGGIGAVASALVGLAAIAGTLAVGPPGPTGMPKPLPPHPRLLRPLLSQPTPRIEPSYERIELGDGGAGPDDPTHLIKLKFSIKEKKHRTHEVEISPKGFLKLIDFRPTVVAAPGGRFSIPVKVHADPEKVKAEGIKGSLDVTVDGDSLLTATAALKNDEVTFAFAGKSLEIDVRAGVEETIELDEPLTVDLEAQERSR